MQGSGPTSILTVSRNRKLQMLRTQILEHAGYRVSEAISDADAMSFIENDPHSFKLVLLCHSVPEKSRVSIVRRIKELNHELPVLMLYNGYDPTAAKVDGSLHNLESPEVWLDMVHFLTQKTAPEDAAD